MKNDFTYEPTFLGGIGSKLDHLHSAFIHARKNYIDCLEHLREMKRISNEPVLVKEWQLPYADTHPRHLAKLYSEVDAYIKHHQNKNWIFSHIEEDEVEEYKDGWDEYPEMHKYIKLYANITSLDEVETSDMYKGAIQSTHQALHMLNIAREDLLEYIYKVDK